MDLHKLTFDQAMGLHEQHNHNVFRMIVEAQKNGTLSPFVGAGLSFPFGYKLWGGVLAELAGYIPIEDEKAMALSQISAGKYEEAAQTILDAYPFMLDQLPIIVNPDRVNTCSDEVKRTSAAWVLPHLFQKGLVITTNFDRVLENMYMIQRNEAIPTVTPMNRDRLDQLCQNQSLGLFKLHGDIGNEAVSIDDLVFTGEQYDKHYAVNSPLVEALSRWFSNHRLLFLGCSLNVDRTMKILQQVVQSQKGIRHFAILGCKKDDIKQRSKELAALGILPIFYDDNNHDAVRVILERLLEETNQDAYQELIRTSQIIPPIPKEECSLMFDSDYFPFSGRTEELDQLEEFCGASDRILWWAVTGPGGMGKSRVVYEFCKGKRAAGWKTERFEAHPSRGSQARSLDELAAWTPAASKTIVVLDDVQAHMETVRSWLSRMDRTARSEDLRILLLERDGKDLSSASWLGTDPCDDGLDDWCYKEKFLRLEPLSDDLLMTIMDNYAAVAGKKLSAERLLSVLDRVDPELKRPLYAIAIADARCQGKDPVSWDRDKVLDTLLQREMDFHFSRLQGIEIQKKKISKKLSTELEVLLANSCIQGFLRIRDVDMAAYPTLQRRISNAEMDEEEFFDRLGILRTAQLRSYAVDQNGNRIDDSLKEETERIVVLSCPDLIKEHLVLKQAFEKYNLDLLPDGWQNNPGHLLFLRKLWVDYPERLKNQTDFWTRFFGATPPTHFPAWIYGDLLWGCTDIFPDLLNQAVDCSAKLYRANDQDMEIASCYAKGLVNLSNSKTPAERVSAVDCLEELHSACQSRQDIAVHYAQGLFNLSCKREPEELSLVVARFEKLYSAHQERQDIAIYYAKSLSNLSYDQTREESKDTVARINKLYVEHHDCQDITAEYARNLCNLSISQPLTECKATVDRLKEIYSANKNQNEVADCYAVSMSALSLLQNRTACAETVTALKELYKSHHDMPFVGNAYARSLAKLLALYDEEHPSTRSDEFKNTIRELENLCYHADIWDGFPDEYASRLVNLALCQSDLVSVQKTLSLSREILNSNPDEPSIQLAHAMTWFNLTLVQKSEEIPSTLSGITSFLRSHSDIIPKFKEELDEYLAKHPDHTERYQVLQEL